MITLHYPLTLLSILISCAAFANTSPSETPAWYDLELGTTYSLALPIEFVEPAPGIAVPTNAQLTFVDQIPLDEIRVQALIFLWKDCPEEVKPRAQNMILLENDQYGVVLDPGCELEIYLENKDLSRASILTFSK